LPSCVGDLLVLLIENIGRHLPDCSWSSLFPHQGQALQLFLFCHPRKPLQSSQANCKSVSIYARKPLYFSAQFWISNLETEQ
jgi:hypothetical protein